MPNLAEGGVSHDNMGHGLVWDDLLVPDLSFMYSKCALSRSAQAGCSRRSTRARELCERSELKRVEVKTPSRLVFHDGSVGRQVSCTRRADVDRAGHFLALRLLGRHFLESCSEAL